MTMKPTRREVVVGAVAVSACGRSEPWEENEDDGVAASAPEEEDVGLIERREEAPTSPIHLTASATIGSNTTGGVNSIALKNPTGGPMEILEIKWAIGGEETIGVDAFGSAVFGGIISCKLDLGMVKLTNGFVPVWNFGRAEDLLKEVHTSTGAPGDTVALTSFYSWRLPRPLYIPEGTILTPTFQHRGLLSRDLNVNISYAGRSVAEKKPPKTVYVPYVSSYVSKVFDFTSGSGVDSDQSTETDLVNPWDENLRLQRFTGRFYTRQQGFGFDALSEQNFPSISNQLTTVQIFDSNGRPIVQNPTPFRQVFAGPTRSWEMDGHVMDPHSHYRAFLRADPPAASFPFSGSMLVQAHIGVVGWRELTKGGPA